jgi:hypothetical protein
MTARGRDPRTGYQQAVSQQAGGRAGGRPGGGPGGQAGGRAARPGQARPGQLQCPSRWQRLQTLPQPPVLEEALPYTRLLPAPPRAPAAARPRRRAPAPPSGITQWFPRCACRPWRPYLEAFILRFSKALPPDELLDKVISGAGLGGSKGCARARARVVWAWVRCGKLVPPRVSVEEQSSLERSRRWQAAGGRITFDRLHLPIHAISPRHKQPRVRWRTGNALTVCYP